MDLAEPHAVFATTHWSVVLAAGTGDSRAARQAWEELARAYWRPLYGHARRRGRAHEEAQDLVQAFFARLLEKAALARADRTRGRFRTFLLVGFDHFLSNANDRANALKRGGGAETIPWSEDDPDCEARTPSSASGDPAGRQFDREWAHALLARALTALERDFVAEGKAAHFEVLRPFLFASPAPGQYDEAAERLGLRPALMPKAVARLRERLRSRVRAEVGQTVATVHEVDEEMRYLVDLVAGI